jgi:protein-tyrosine phosphatase
MIDTHLHILPGIDDGPETMEDSIALARVLVQEGIHSAIATPHYNDVFLHHSAIEIQERVNDVQIELDRHSIPLRLYPGHEALIKPGLIEDIQTGRLATLNGSRYLLLELWNSAWLPETERVIFELQAFGITPILAHPERYHVIQREPERITSLLTQGVLIQITASSLIGMQGRTAQRTAESLLKRGQVHCIASDGHGLYKRAPGVARGLQCACALTDQAYLKLVTEIFPAKIINNGNCTLPVLQFFKTDKRFGKVRSL